MVDHAISKDGERIHFESTGSGETALLFVHGWLGNLRWWDSVRDEFSKEYQIVQMDLGGHGKSSANRKQWSIKSYAEDVQAVVEKLGLTKAVLVGHSMSGSIVVEALQLMPKRVPLLLLVDTLQDLDHMPTLTDLAPLFNAMRSDFVGTMKENLPKFTFSASTPQAIQERLLQEVTQSPPSVAIPALEPFYSTDMRETCKKIQIPVRAINSDLAPTNEQVCRKYFSNFGFVVIYGVGHYPMLEAPKSLIKLCARSS